MSANVLVQIGEVGLCSQTDPDAFHPERGGSAREAKKVCNRCEAKGPCLEYALAHDEEGVWGGTSGHERRRMKRQASA